MSCSERVNKVVEIYVESMKESSADKVREAFHPNATQLTLHFGSSIFAFWRESINRKQCIFAINNISDKSQKISLLELNLIGTESWTDLLAKHQADYAAGNGSYDVVTWAYLWAGNYIEGGLVDDMTAFIFSVLVVPNFDMDDIPLASPEYVLKWVQIFYNNKSALKFYS